MDSSALLFAVLVRSCGCASRSATIDREPSIPKEPNGAIGSLLVLGVPADGVFVGPPLLLDVGVTGVDLVAVRVGVARQVGDAAATVAVLLVVVLECDRVAVGVTVGVAVGRGRTDVGLGTRVGVGDWAPLRIVVDDALVGAASIGVADIVGVRLVPALGVGLGGTGVAVGVEMAAVADGVGDNDPRVFVGVGVDDGAGVVGPGVVVGGWIVAVAVAVMEGVAVMPVGSAVGDAGTIVFVGAAVEVGTVGVIGTMKMTVGAPVGVLTIVGAGAGVLGTTEGPRVPGPVTGMLGVGESSGIGAVLLGLAMSDN